MDTMLLIAADGMLPTILQLLVTVGVCFLGWWGLGKYRENPDKDFMQDLFSGDMVFKLEVTALFTTASECVGLSILAIGRNVDVFNAVSRFVIFCGIEIGVILFFITYSSKAQEWIIRKLMTRMLKDGKIDFLEIIQAILAAIAYIIVALLLFPFFCVPTLAICFFYFEASGVITVSFGHISYIPWELIKIEEAVDVAFAGVELAAYAVIWLTPIITLMQIILTPIEFTFKIYKELTGKKDKDRKKKKKKGDWEDDDDDDWSTSSIDDKVDQLFDSISDIKSISKQRIVKKYEELIGANGKTPTNSSIGTTKTVKEFKEDLCDLFLGSDKKSDPQGILGYRRLEQMVEASSQIELNKIMQEHTTQAAIVKSQTGTAKTNAEAQVVKLTAEKKKVLQNIKDYKKTMDDIKDDMEDHLQDIGLYP